MFLIIALGISKLVNKVEIKSSHKRVTTFTVGIFIIIASSVAIGWGIAYATDPHNNLHMIESLGSYYRLREEWEDQSHTDAINITDDLIYWGAYPNPWIYDNTLTPPTPPYYLNVSLGTILNPYRDTSSVIFNFSKWVEQEVGDVNGTSYYYDRSISEKGNNWLWIRMRHGWTNPAGFGRPKIWLNLWNKNATEIIAYQYYDSYLDVHNASWFDLEGNNFSQQNGGIVATGWPSIVWELVWSASSTILYARYYNGAGPLLSTIQLEIPSRIWDIGLIEFRAEQTNTYALAQAYFVLDDVLIYEANYEWNWLSVLGSAFAFLGQLLFSALLAIGNILALAFQALINVLVAMLNAVGNALGAGNIGTMILSIGGQIIAFLGFVITNIASIFGWVVSLVGTGLGLVVDFLPWLAIIPALIMFDFIFMALRMGKSMSIDPLRDGVEKYMHFGMIIFRVFRGIASVLMGFLGFIAGLVPFT